MASENVEPPPTAAVADPEKKDAPLMNNEHEATKVKTRPEREPKFNDYMVGFAAMLLCIYSANVCF
jgi:hypothetical protein